MPDIATIVRGAGQIEEFVTNTEITGLDVLFAVLVPVAHGRAGRSCRARVGASRCCRELR